MCHSSWGIFGLFAMYLRRWLQETPIFKEMQARKTLADELPLKSVVVNHKKEVFVCMLLTWLLSAGIVVVILMTPTYLQKQFGVLPALALQANSLAIVALVCGCVIAGLVIDRFGASKTFIVGSLMLAASTWSFYHTNLTDPTQLFTHYMMAGFCVGIVGAVPYVMVRAFPAEVRFNWYILLLQCGLCHFWWFDTDCSNPINEDDTNGPGLLHAVVIAGRGAVGDLSM